MYMCVAANYYIKRKSLAIFCYINIFFFYLFFFKYKKAREKDKLIIFP